MLDPWCTITPSQILPTVSVLDAATSARSHACTKRQLTQSMHSKPSRPWRLQMRNGFLRRNLISLLSSLFSLLSSLFWHHQRLWRGGVVSQSTHSFDSFRLNHSTHSLEYLTRLIRLTHSLDSLCRCTSSTLASPAASRPRNMRTLLQYGCTIDGAPHCFVPWRPPDPHPHVVFSSTCFRIYLCSTS